MADQPEKKLKEEETLVSKDAVLLSMQFDYGIDLKNRIIRIVGDIDSETFERFDLGMTELESRSRKSITIKINSEGGDPSQALAIVTRLRESKCLVITKGYGIVASAATMILAAGTQHRSMSKLGTFLHHESSYIAEGTQSQISAVAREQERQELLWSKLLAELSVKDAKFWRNLSKNKDAYLTPDQLLKYGVIDSIF